MHQQKLLVGERILDDNMLLGHVIEFQRARYQPDSTAKCATARIEGRRLTLVVEGADVDNADLNIDMQCAQRAKLLHSRFRASKVYCKCFRPMHRDRCPLVRVSPKQPWPGCDGYISEEDMKFLNSLVPWPAWWSKAWGRKRKENLISDQRPR